jgi:hypothetical protein
MLRSHLGDERTRGVVYTCLFGSKEELRFSRTPDSVLRHVLFSDSIIEVPAGVELILVPDIGLGVDRLSRLPKILPHKYLWEHSWSLYVDHRAILKMIPESIYDTYLSQCDHVFLCFARPERDCVYDEAVEVIRLQYDSEAVVRKQIDTYKLLGYPKNNGLIAGTFLLRRHNNPILRQVSEAWYMHVLRYSKRDQISLNVVSWMHNLNILYLAGSLKDNDLTLWEQIPVRIPATFCKHIYEWLGKRKSSVEQKTRSDFFKEIADGERPRFERHNCELCHLANKFKTDRGHHLL